MQEEKVEFWRPEKATWLERQFWRTHRLDTGNQNLGSGQLAAGS